MAERIQKDVMLKLLRTPNEAQTHWFVAREAMILGHGGSKKMCELTGLSKPTIIKGIKELKSEERLGIGQRIRQLGAGRKRIEERRKWASPCLDFIKRNSKGLFIYKKLLEKEIEHTNNAAEIIFSLFKPQYKVMKQFQNPEGVQIHLNLFTLRHNFRVFPRGKQKGYSPVQLEGLNVSLNEWSDLLYSES